MKRIILLIYLLTFSSCAFWNRVVLRESSTDLLVSYQKIDNEDYLMHLAALGNYYLQTPGVKILKLSGRGSRYLAGVYARLTAENELYYTKKIEPSFYVVENKMPFVFSLPDGKFFLSSELIFKYLKHEDILISILSAEIFRIHYGLYSKKTIVALGFIDTERLLSVLRLTEKHQFEIDKWAFYTMKRAGYDAIAYLSWLQIQNRNSMDFLLLHGGDTQRISRQEFVFKKFIVEQGISNDDTLKFERRSSADFYNFKTDLTRVEYERKKDRG